MRQRPNCECVNSDDPKFVPDLHDEVQDTAAPGWVKLLQLVEEAALDGRKRFVPLEGLTDEERLQIVTLPPTIAKLKKVQELFLYGSDLVRLPPEIGSMPALEVFEPYTSYALHWFPYEITRCKRLRSSCVSTRALYGNYKYRPAFPQLPALSAQTTPASCSVCLGPFAPLGPLQYWISLQVGTDVLPLLVHACSTRCISKLPKPPEGYVQTPHEGGHTLKQPQPR